jgi:AraC-like DNA-binding protein
MDVLSDFRMEGVTFWRARLTAPWAFQCLSGRDNLFYAVRAGGAWFDSLIAGRPPVWCPAGSVVAVSRGDAHSWRDSETTSYGPPVEQLPAQPIAAGALARPAIPGETIITIGKAPLAAFRTFLRASRFLVIPAEAEAVSKRISMLLTLIEEELAYRGEDMDSGSIVRRLAEIITIETTRHLLRTSPHAHGNLMLASEDRYLRPVLQLIHERPELEWTVEELASRAGLGRSAFAARFRKMMNLSPIQYLTMIRMRRAASQMHRSDVVLAEIALNVGYRSEAAFNRAFSRQYAITPGRYYRLYCRKE